MKLIAPFILLVAFGIGVRFLVLSEANIKADPFVTRINKTSMNLALFAPVTGPLANYGKEIVEGATAAKETLAARGIAVNLIVEDVCLPEESATALRSRLTRSTIDGIAANFCVVGMMGMTPLLQQNGLFAFQMSALPDELLSRNSNVLSRFPTIKEEAAYLAERRFREGSRKVAILAVETHWGENFARHFRESFKAAGGDIVFESHQQLGDTDFRTTIHQIRESGADTVFLAHLGPQAGALLKQAHELKLAIPVIGTDEGGDPSVKETAGSGFEQFRWAEDTVDLSDQDSFPAASDVHGIIMSIFTKRAYESTMNAAEAVTSCGNNIECIRSNFGRSGSNREKFIFTMKKGI